MQRSRSTFRVYRGPLLAGLLLALGATAWAWQQRDAQLERERHTMIRHALSLESGLAVLVEQIDMADPTADAQLRAAIEAHLRVRPPMVFAAVHRGDAVIVHVGAHDGPPPDRPPPPEAPAPEPDARPDGGVLVLEHAFGPPCATDPAAGPPPALWSWQSAPDAASVCPQLTLVVGVEMGFPPEVTDPANRRFALAIILACLAIGALVLVWARSIKTRALLAELDAERRERAVLTDMNLAAAGLAHETKNPIGIIFGLAQRLAEDPKATPRQHLIADQIIDASDRATARLSDFINFARVRAPEWAEVDLKAVIDRVVGILQYDFEEHGVTLAQVGPGCRVRCDVAMLEQMLVNLLLNSLHASPEGTTTTIDIAHAGETASVAVIDQGRGIPAELLPEIFKPYVTGRPDGHGLGLAIVKRIADQHQWRVTVSAPEAGGTCMRVTGLRVIGSEVG